MSTNEIPRTNTNVRGGRYGEVLAVYLRDGGLHGEVFVTQNPDGCPQELWDTLDAGSIAADLGATMVKLNGPRYWVIDGVGQKVDVVEPVLRDFNGMIMRRAATVDLGAAPSMGPYTERHVNRGAIFFFDAGKPIYELVNPAGQAFVMQAYSVAVDASLSEGSLATLGTRLALPEGWSFRTRVLDQELIVDTSKTIATVVQDEFENSYTLPS